MRRSPTTVSNARPTGRVERIDLLAGVAHPATVVVPVITGLAALSVIPLRGYALTYLAGGPAIAGLTAVLLLRWRDRHVVAPRHLAMRALLRTQGRRSEFA